MQHECWLLHKRINHNLVATAIDRVTDQTDVYRRAITLSLEMARDGCTLATDALCLCNHISDGTASVQVLRQFVWSMHDLARDAEARALNVQGQFRSVRRALYEVGFLYFPPLHVQWQCHLCPDITRYSLLCSWDTEGYTWWSAWSISCKWRYCFRSLTGIPWGWSTWYSQLRNRRKYWKQSVNSTPLIELHLWNCTKAQRTATLNRSLLTIQWPSYTKLTSIWPNSSVM